MKQYEQPKWKGDYLAYLKVPEKEPTLQYLTELATAHLNRIPFENVSTFLQFQEYHLNNYLPMDTEGFVNRLYEKHTGATCFVLNSSFGELLESLGFSSRYAFLGGGHMALLVKVPGSDEEVYIDVGNGSPFFEPVHLETDPDNVSKFGNIEVMLRPEDEEGKYKYYRYANDKPMIWEFDTNIFYEFDDFQPAIKDYFKPNGIFTSSIRVQIWQLAKNRSLSLVNNVLSIQYRHGESEKHILGSVEEIREVIDEEFEMPKLPVEEAIEILQDLDIDIFKKQKGMYVE